MREEEVREEEVREEEVREKEEREEGQGGREGVRRSCSYHRTASVSCPVQQIL